MGDRSRALKAVPRVLFSTTFLSWVGGQVGGPAPAFHLSAGRCTHNRRDPGAHQAFPALEVPAGRLGERAMGVVGTIPASDPDRPFLMYDILRSGGTAGFAPASKGFNDLARRGDRPSATHPGLAFTDQEGVVLPGWAQDAPGNHSRVVAKRASSVNLAQGQRGGARAKSGSIN